jgi:hypothetical protein
MPEPRSITHMLVGWCPECNLHYGAYEGTGMHCLMECERTLVKRRRWVCSVCECSCLSKAGAEEHECYECY